jgi:hypothetical protein
MIIIVFWDVVSFSLVDRNRCFTKTSVDNSHITQLYIGDYSNIEGDSYH